jgi:hypothetical protein
MRPDVYPSEGGPMENIFDAEVFVYCLYRGDFDRGLNEEIGKLSRTQLEQVVFLMEDHARITNGSLSTAKVRACRRLTRS